MSGWLEVVHRNTEESANRCVLLDSESTFASHRLRDGLRSHAARLCDSYLLNAKAVDVVHESFLNHLTLLPRNFFAFYGMYLIKQRSSLSTDFLDFSKEFIYNSKQYQHKEVPHELSR